MPKVEVTQIKCEDGLFGVTCVIDGNKKKLWLSPKEVVLNYLAAQQSVQPTVAKCAPDQHDFSKGLECAKCGELLF